MVTFPPMPAGTRDENIRNCVTILMLDCPGITRDRAELIVRRCAEGPEENWIAWSASQPTNGDAPIIGRDCLGYMHFADHLIGTDGMWAEHWQSIRCWAEGDTELEE